MVWLLANDPNGHVEVAEKSLRVVAPGTNEDRKIHVDGRSFFLGIPTARSFALDDLPPGVDIAWSSAAQHMAAGATYATDELSDFAAALNQMLLGK